MKARGAALLAAVWLGAAGCHRRELQLFGRQTFPLGQSMELVAGRHYWAFPAKPGERYRFEAEWPDGALELRAGSDWRDKGEEDGDDAKNVTPAKVQSLDAHRFVATWEIGPQANTGFFSVTLYGVGVHPIRVKMDRE